MRPVDEPTDLRELGALDKLADGGQGVVYRAARMPGELYKRYHDLSQWNVGELKRLIRRVHADPMPGAARERILAGTAWPTGVVLEDGEHVGMMMPEAPAHFTTIIGGSPRLKELQFLVFAPKPMWSEVRLPDADQRRELALGYVRLFKALHDGDIIVGDVSPRNLLWTLDPHPAVYAIDCDGFRVNGYPAAVPQAQTPDWVDTAQETGKAGFDGDRFKLALLVLRVLLTEPKVTPADVAADPRRREAVGERVAALAARVAAGERCHAAEWLRALDDRPTITFDPVGVPPQRGRPEPRKGPDRPVLRFDEPA
jgi:DNA-binding helix-hairpin-helix protein with protein kinase domain